MKLRELKTVRFALDFLLAAADEWTRAAKRSSENESFLARPSFDLICAASISPIANVRRGSLILTRKELLRRDLLLAFFDLNRRIRRITVESVATAGGWLMGISFSTIVCFV